MTFDIRRASGSDAAVLTEVAFGAKRRWGYPEEWIQLWSEDLTVDKSYIETNYVYVASENSRIVGWCAVSAEQGDHQIEHCWVEPKVAGRGVGRLLIQQVFALAADLGWPAISVISDPHAEGFYSHLGFRRVGEHPSVPAGRLLPVMEASVPKGEASIPGHAQCTNRS